MGDINTKNINSDDGTTDTVERCMRCKLSREEIRNKQLICQDFGKVYTHHIYQ